MHGLFTSRIFGTFVERRVERGIHMRDNAVLVAIIMGCSAVLGAILPKIIDIVNERLKAGKDIFSEKEASAKPKRIRVWSLIAGLFGMAVGFPLGLYIVGSSPVKSKSLATVAWVAYNNANWVEAIMHARECIDEFEPQALYMQKQLAKEKVKVPAIGIVRDEETKMEIFNRGPLNDVASCWFLIGRSLEKQQRERDAIDAYKNAIEFSYARVWDPFQGLFWPPAEAAQQRIDYLQERRH